MDLNVVAALETALDANSGGEVKNLIWVSDTASYRSRVRDTLRAWACEKGLHLVELDECEYEWLADIQSRELFGRLNEPNTILLVENYGTVNWYSPDENTPRNFMRDLLLHRRYGCGNGWCPPDDLRNLLFLVALNDGREMYCDADERDSFEWGPPEI